MDEDYLDRLSLPPYPRLITEEEMAEIIKQKTIDRKKRLLLERLIKTFNYLKEEFDEQEN